MQSTNTVLSKQVTRLKRAIITIFPLVIISSFAHLAPSFLNICISFAILAVSGYLSRIIVKEQSGEP